MKQLIAERDYIWSTITRLRGNDAGTGLRVLLAGLALASFLVASGCNREKTETPEGGVSKEEALKSRDVVVAPVLRHDFTRSIRSTGSLMPREQATIRALVDGPITAMNVDIGDDVEAGDVLFVTRPIDADLNVKLAQASLMTAKAGLDDLRAWRRKEEVASMRAQMVQADTECERLQSDSKRAKDLFASKSISASEWDRARSAAKVAEALLDVAREQLRVAEAGPTKEKVQIAQGRVAEAEANLSRAKQQLEDTSVKAPFGGVVTRRFSRLGDFAKRGDSILDLANITALEAENQIPERFSGRITQGLPVEIEIKSTGLKRQGTSTSGSDAVDLKTRTFMIKVSVDNSDRTIKAGAFVIAVAELPAVVNVLAIPKKALLEDEGRSFVWIANDSRAKRVFVRTGEENEESIEIHQGLTGDEQVVVEGQGILAEGDTLLISPIQDSTQ